MLYKVPKNIGRCRQVMAIGGKYAVWNGKHGPDEFVLEFRRKEDAATACALINTKGRGDELAFEGVIGQILPAWARQRDVRPSRQQRKQRP